MGGLFSSEPTEQPQIRRPTSTYHYQSEEPATARRDYGSNSSEEQRRQVLRLLRSYYRTLDERAQPRFSYEDDLRSGFESLNISAGRTRRVEPPTRVQRNSNFLNIQSSVQLNYLQVVRFIELSEYDMEYLAIKRKVSNKRNFKVDSIERIENPYLMKAYELKKEQKKKQYSIVEERLLFHGTTHENLEKICKFNFNWRLCQAHKYGMGVSFSPNTTYASNYSDKHKYNKVMIVAMVLIGRSCFGHENMVLPDEGCDTSQKGQEAIVVVKYEDNEFCPVYKINYHLVNPNVGRRKKRGGNSSVFLNNDIDFNNSLDFYD